MSDNPETLQFLVAEDEATIALEWATAFEKCGVNALGPVASVEKALDIVNRTERLDGAILDIHLIDANVYPVADALIDRNVSFAFATGFDSVHIPKRFSNIPCYRKPFMGDIIIGQMVRNRLIERDLEKSAGLLAAMANTKRLAILDLLVGGELPVNLIAEQVGLSQSALSQHLAKLRAQKLVSTRRDAQTIYYSSESPAVLKILEALNQIIETGAVSHVPPGKQRGPKAR